MNVALQTSWLSRHRWPLGIAGFIAVMMLADLALVTLALSREGAAPQADYYERAKDWDRVLARREACIQLGWTATLSAPRSAAFDAAELRPVDLRLRDREGRPVSGLVGTLRAARPSDTRLGDEAPLFELPHAPGEYRALLRLPATGLWEIAVQARRDGAEFVDVQRLTVEADH